MQTEKQVWGTARAPSRFDESSRPGRRIQLRNQKRVCRDAARSAFLQALPNIRLFATRTIEHFLHVAHRACLYDKSSTARIACRCESNVRRARLQAAAIKHP